MGIEHPYGKALQDWAQGQSITMPPGKAKSANQRAQNAALTLAIAFQNQTGLPDAIAGAKDLYQRQLDHGHMALDVVNGLNEYMIPDTHAFIWYAAMATLHELAWHRLDESLEGVADLRKLSRQWWQHHLSMCSVMSVPADQAGASPDNQLLNVGSVVAPGARADSGRMSYHRDVIYRRVAGIPQVGQALKNKTWWTPKAPDLVGPYWVSKNLDTLPQTKEIGPDFLPMLTNPMTIQRYTLGFRAFFADGVIPTAAFSPTVRAWMDYSTWQAGFTLLPSGPADPEPAAPWPGELVAEYKVKGKTPDPGDPTAPATPTTQDPKPGDPATDGN
jgi:hypothetical protein